MRNEPVLAYIASYGIYIYFDGAQWSVLWSPAHAGIFSAAFPLSASDEPRRAIFYCKHLTHRNHTMAWLATAE